MEYAQLIATGYYFNVFKPIAAKYGPAKAMFIGLLVDKQNYWNKRPKEAVNGWWFCSQERINKETGISLKAQKKYTDWLVELEILETKKQSEREHNIYRIYYRMQFKKLNLLLQDAVQTYEYGEDEEPNEIENYKQKLIEDLKKEEDEDEVSLTADRNSPKRIWENSQSKNTKEERGGATTTSTRSSKQDGEFVKQDNGTFILDNTNAKKNHERFKNEEIEITEILTTHLEEISKIAQKNEWIPRPDINEFITAQMWGGMFSKDGKIISEGDVKKQLKMMLYEYYKGV